MNKIASILLLVVVALVLAGCGSPTPAMGPEAVPVRTQAPAATQAPAKTEAPAASTQAVSAALNHGNPAPPQGRMIIKDATMTVLVQDTQIAMDRVTTMAADQGGYVISSRTWLQNEHSFAELRLGVPSANFETAVNFLRSLGTRVLDENISGQDVSAEYADLEARLSNLEATADRVRQFLADAKTVDESLKINATLSDLEGQIEQVKGQMKFYEGRSAFSTITITLQPEFPTPTPTPTPTPLPGWSAAATAGNASKVMVSMLQGMADLVIWAAFLLWPFLVVLIIAWLVLRRVRLRRPLSQKNIPS